MGLHWSSVQLFAISIYATFIYFTAKINNLKSFLKEVKKDITNLFDIWNFKKNRLEYDKENSWFLGFIYSCMVGVSGFFIFETFWVFFYNYFQFGDWFYPVYRTMIIGDLLSYPLLRNITFSFSALIGICIIWFPHIKINGKWKCEYNFRLRKNKFTLIFIFLALVSWMFWIYYPLNNNSISFNDLDKDKVLMGSNMTIINDYSLYVYPNQDLFPQTCLTFYPIQTLELNRVDNSEIFGFYVQDDLVHTTNLIVKYLTVLAVCYPFLLYAEKRKS